MSDPVTALHDEVLRRLRAMPGYEGNVEPGSRFDFISKDQETVVLEDDGETFLDQTDSGKTIPDDAALFEHRFIVGGFLAPDKGETPIARARRFVADVRQAVLSPRIEIDGVRRIRLADRDAIQPTEAGERVLVVVAFTARIVERYS